MVLALAYMAVSIVRFDPLPSGLPRSHLEQIDQELGEAPTPAYRGTL